jgi:subtilisin-like proprotein convertase family protein
MKKNYPKIKFNHQYFLKNRLASLLACCLFLFFSIGQAQTFNGTGLPGAIPDLGSISSVAVSNLTGIYGEDFEITNVTINITHGVTSDLNIVLQAPDGVTILNLFTYNGGFSDNLVNTQFETGGDDISNDVGPYTGVYAPEGGSFLDTFNGLSVNGNWTLIVYDDDGAVTGTFENYSITFGVPASCLYPTNVITSPLSTTTAEVSWDAVANALDYDWLLMAEGDGPDPLTALDLSATPIASNTTSLSGLTSGTTYDFYVRSNCGGTTSQWSPVKRFTMSLNYCGSTSFFDNGGNGNYLNNSFETTTITPVVLGESVTVEFLSFNTDEEDDGLMIYNGPNTSSPIIPSSFINSGLGNLPDGAWTGTSTFSANGEVFISSHPTGALTFVFISNGLTSSSGWEAEVTCGPPPTCFRPNNLTASSITATTVDLSWDAVASTTNGYDWVLMASGGDPDNDTPVEQGFTSVPNVSVNINNLTATTTYDAYVRSNCGAGDVSFWSIVESFTSSCGVIIPDYLQSFPSTIIPCWSFGDAGTPATGPTSFFNDRWIHEGFLNTGSPNSVNINI